MGQLSRLAPLLLLAVAPLPAAPPRDGAACWLPPPSPGGTNGMAHLPAATYRMGAGALRPDDAPERAEHVGAFWIDRADVTNAAFARFVAATGYVTEAERNRPDLPPASLVFTGAAPGTDLANPAAWWQVVPGANWRHPEGPGSDLRGRETYPVVHVSYADAAAYARWLGHDLPTEAEWEYAARGGLTGAPFVWGAEEAPRGTRQANTWQGPFPGHDTGADGYRARLAPVGCFPANGYGLFDMAGNAWQWTKSEEAGRHVIKGGSYLCAPNYCFRYRPAAREHGPPDSGASHIGFRTVQRDG